MTQKIKELNTKKNLFRVLVSIAVLSAGMYLFFMNSAVFNTLERERAGRELSVVSAEVANLEQSYLSLKNNITLAVAYEKGFKEVSHISYVSRNAMGDAVAMSDEN
ncbi:MAG: hypothetical protein WC757_02545 [Candidatus Paceibacterota bacterium]|jgi:hypothetical protein